MSVVIKNNKDSVDQETTKLYHMIKDYQSEVERGKTIVMETKLKLLGKGYDSLFNSLDVALKEQQRIVAECQILRETTDKFLKEMGAAETSARGRFPS